MYFEAALFGAGVERHTFQELVLELFLLLFFFVFIRAAILFLACQDQEKKIKTKMSIFF